MRLCEHESRDYRKIVSLKKERRSARKRGKTKPCPTNTTALIHCPDKIDVITTRNREKLLNFFEKLRDYFQGSRRRIHIDFSSVSSIESHAGILLLAELDRLRALFPQKTVRASHPRQKKEHEALCQIGVSRLCGMKSTCPSHHDVIHWNAASSDIVDGELYSQRLIEPFELQLPHQLQDHLWRSVQEAMANIPEHAYSSERMDGINKNYTSGKWWMFSQIKNNQLTVIIADLGAGIPRTLTSKSKESLKPHLRSIQRWMKMEPKKDSEVLSAVMKKSSKGYPEPDQTLSRTGEPHRGRGIYNILQLIQSISGSHIVVLSNKGLWRASLNNPMMHEYKSSIYGTVISWLIPLAPRAEVQDE